VIHFAILKALKGRENCSKMILRISKSALLNCLFKNGEKEIKLVQTRTPNSRKDAKRKNISFNPDHSLFIIIASFI